MANKFYEGNRNYFDGLELVDNPYQRETEEYLTWIEGWLTAKEWSDSD